MMELGLITTLALCGAVITNPSYVRKIPTIGTFSSTRKLPTLPKLYKIEDEQTVNP